jgi:integrase
MGSRRRRFGRVRQLPSRRWQARYVGPDGVLRTAPTTFARKSDAERWLSTIETDLARGRWVDPRAGDITVRQWSERWFRAAQAHLKVKTQAGYRSLLDTKIYPTFGDVPLSAIRPIAVSEWVASLRRRGLSPSRVRQSYRLFAQILWAAVENDLLTITPCRGVRLPRMPDTEPQIVTETEVDKVIALLPAPHDALVALLAYGGLRIGEAFALRRRSVDLEGGTVTVSETLVEIQGRLSFDSPKSHQSRTISLPDFVVARLADLLGNGVGAGGDALLFTTARTGLPLHYNAWRATYFDRAVHAAGLVGVTPHDLRASHATWVAERHGVMAAAARLGHAHASVTTRHYARAARGHDGRVADELAVARAARADAVGTPEAGARKGHDRSEDSSS